MQPGTNSRLTPFDMRCIEQAMDYIDRHYTDKISAECLAMEVGLSKAKIQAGFQRRHDVTLHKYIQQVRILKAKELLIDTNKPVKAVADAAGFPNESHFCKVFKKLCDTSPVKFRLMMAL